MKFWKRLIISGSVFILIMGTVAVATRVFRMAGASRPAEAAVAPFLESSEAVLVDKGNWITFQPAGQTPTIGFIFYPGGNVDHQAYAPPLHQIAAQGFLVVDVSMPFDLAVLAPGKALDVIKAYPQVNTWVIGGHSLGGAMAARAIDSNPGRMQGLVLWAGYPAESNSLAATEIAVLSIYGTQDGLSDPAKIERYAPLLPQDTRWIEIQGGNHAQFGYYGTQNRDRPALISREEQQAQVIRATVGFLRSLEP